MTGVRTFVWVGAVVLAAAARATARDPPDGLALDLLGERAGISQAASRSAWWSSRAQLTYRRAGQGGALLAVEPLRRRDATDTTFVAAGWRHAGAWSASAEVGLTPKADFHYRRALRLEVFRRVKGGFVGHASYHVLAFPTQNVHLLAPSVTRYAARSELHARLILGKSATDGLASQAVLVSAHFDVGERLRLGGGAAVGERIFDVTALPRAPIGGWLAFGEARLSVGNGSSIGLLARAGAEGKSFDQAALGLAYRKRF